MKGFRLPKLLCALLLPLAMLLAPVAHSGPSHPTRVVPRKPDLPALTLADEKSEGQRAIDLLGARLPEVAAHYRKSPDQLGSLLLNDSTHKIDRRGRLFVEDVLPAQALLPAAAASIGISGALVPSNQTFLLHSHIGAKRTIYLNFTGAILTGTAWNNIAAATQLIAQPFDMDGAPNSFNSAELERVQYIWQRVAEDYAPFDVDVTTAPPTADQLTRSSTSDDIYGTTVLITNRTGVYDCICGGVSFVGVFDDIGDGLKPALVFYDALGSDEKFVAEAAAHEAGHNVGLSHDGQGLNVYYAGHGLGLTSWAPIMGVSYSANLTQWSKGEYLDANNVEDDFLVMGDNGLPLRLDQDGDEAGSATALHAIAPPTTTTDYSIEGVIERAADVDVFSFSAGPGPAVFSLTGAARATNLDAALELRDINGNLLASDNAADLLDANISANLPANGTYFVAVKGVGKGDPLVDGYTDYASVGQYALSGSVPTVVGIPPDAFISVFPFTGAAPLTSTFSSGASFDNDGTIVSYRWTFGDGTTATGTDVTHTFAAAGTYLVGLLVTDNSGLSGTRSVPIVVTPPVPVVPMYISDFIMSVFSVRERSYAQASILVRNASTGAPVPGAVVSGKWTGLVPGTATATADSSGFVTINSRLTEKRGTFIFTVTDVTASGFSYQSNLNIKTSDSIRTLKRR